MAAVTTAVVAGLGTAMSVYGAVEQGKAAKKAAAMNAQEAELNAQLTAEKAAEDERQFRLSFRREQGRNQAAIGASGIKAEGSPLEVLQDNAAMAEQDALRIRRGGQIERDAFMRQAGNYRQAGRAASRAAGIGAAASLLSGAGNVYSTGQKSGAWK
jgi:hypothetical protein